MASLVRIVQLMQGATILAIMNVPTWVRYARAVMDRAKLYLGGGFSLIVLIGVYQGISGRSVSPFVYTICASVTMLSAIWVYGLEQYRALEARLFIGEIDHYTHLHPQLTHCYRIRIGNKSQAKTIQGATAQIIQIQPKPEHYTWGDSCPLQWKDSLKPAGSTERWERTRDIRAGSPEEADFIQATVNQGLITVNHSVDLISEHTIPLSPTGHYIITVEVKGQDVPPVKADFDVWMNTNGVLQCTSLGSY